MYVMSRVNCYVLVVWRWSVELAWFHRLQLCAFQPGLCIREGHGSIPQRTQSQHRGTADSKHRHNADPLEQAARSKAHTPVGVHTHPCADHDAADSALITSGRVLG